MSTNRINIGGLQVGIIVLTVATAIIHLSRNFPDVVFILNCLGYLSLLAALYLPIPELAAHRSLARYGLMVFAALTILAWIGMGDKNLATGSVGYIAKVIEIVLIVLLWMENQKSKT
jgi:hypothetical protein